MTYRHCPTAVDLRLGWCLRDLRRDVEIDAPSHAVGCRALGGMRRQCAIRLLTRACRNLQTIAHANARDPQHVVNRFDVTLDIRLKGLSRHRNLTHYQCAGKGAKQSTADGADHVVERGRHLLIWFNAVELLDPAVYAEPDRLGETLQIRVPQRSFDPFDPQSAGVYHCHHVLLSYRSHAVRAVPMKRASAERTAVPARTQRRGAFDKAS